MKINKNQSGFTLLELLIATSIFAATIVIIVSAFGLSTKNQRQIRINRDISQNIRYASTEISRQIELSYNGPVINKSGGEITQGGRRVYNFAIANSPGANQAVPDYSNNGSGDVLFVRGGDNHCRIYFLDTTGRIAVYIDKKEGCTGDWGEPYYLTDSGTDIGKLEFEGTMNTKGKEGQAFTRIIIESTNSDRTEFTISLNTRTVATIRNYGGEN